MKPLGPESIPALIDGTVSVIVYVRAHPDVYFQYLGQDLQPSVTGRFRVGDLPSFRANYVDALNQGWVPGLKPSELVDQHGNRFTVVRYGISLMDDLPTLETAALPLDWFFTLESAEAEQQTQTLILYDRETHLNLLLNDFLNTHPQAGIVKFREWLVSDRDGQWLDHSNEYLWKLKDGSDFRKSQSQVESQLSKLKGIQRRMMG